MAKAKRKPHLLSVPDTIRKKLDERGALSAQTGGEFARQLLACFLDELPLPPRYPAGTEPPVAARPPEPPPRPVAPVVPPSRPAHIVPPLPVAPVVPPAAVRPYAVPVAPQHAPPPPPVVATGPNPDIDFDNPDDQALRQANELLARTAPVKL